MSTEAPRRKIVLFEMNEVPFRVLDDYAARHPRSHLARLMARAKQLNTVCEDQVELDPWTSWPTLHRGVIDEQHRVRHLGQSLEWADRHFPPIWELVARAGRAVGVFGSLHSARVPPSVERYAFYLPDFFADEVFAHPAGLRAFQAFNLLMTRRSARNVDEAIPPAAAAAFLRTYVRAGFHWPTLARLAACLLAERARPHLKARRRSLQPLLALDLFLPLMRRAQPDLATFYTNHVAANMHRFWAAGFPDDVDENPMPADWRAKYAGEIDYAMQVLDVMLGRLRAYADAADTLLLVASSIGQAAVPATRIKGFTTIVDLERFMARLGLDRGDWQRKPAMVPCLSVQVDPAKADAFEARLSSLSIGGRRVRTARHEGHEPFTYDRKGEGFHLFVYFEALDLGAEDLGLGFFAHQEEVGCSGRHTPFGSLLVYDPRRAAAPQPRATASTLAIAPALLANFGIPAPRYMAAADPRLLDVSQAAARGAPWFRGGGVEAPVSRLEPRSVHYALPEEAIP